MDKGLKTLFTIYKSIPWDEACVSEEELSFAKETGYLFDYPEYKTHSDTLNRARSVLAQIDPRDIANAFLFSLSTRKLEYRPALASYYYAAAIPEHEFMHSYNEMLAALANHCYFCGWSAWKTAPSEHDMIRGYNYNFLNYTRYKYGGSPIGSININYALFDLEQFMKLPKVVPTDGDRQIFAEILSCINRLDGSDKAGKMRDAILKAKIFKCNKDEVAVLLGALGVCGILAGHDFPSYDVFFANEYERDPVEHKNDFAYPVNRWRVRDGINTKKLIKIFGEDFSAYRT